MGKYAHCVVIRFRYPEITEGVKWRFNYLKSEVLPRLLRQSRQDFDLAILCNPQHRDLIKSLGHKIIPCFIKEEWVGQQHVDFLPYENIIGLRRYKIQTAVDSDDLILREDYIAKIESLFASKRHSCYLSFQPYIQDLGTG